MYKHNRFECQYTVIEIWYNENIKRLCPAESKGKIWEVALTGNSLEDDFNQDSFVTPFIEIRLVV
jgi:hypothetical protein